MKTLCLTACFLVGVWNGVAAAFPPLYNTGSLTVKILTMQQGLDEATVNSKTSTAGSGTTVTTLSKSTVTNSFLDSADLFALLENSFATNFPAGSKLIVSRHGDYLIPWIVDSTGTNIIFNMATNFDIAHFADARVHADSQTLISKSGSSGDSVSGALAETITELVEIHYNDTGLTTRDGTHTQFSITCLLTRKTSETLATQHIKDTIKIQGVGSGTVRDQSVVLQLTASANITGVMDPL